MSQNDPIWSARVPPVVKDYLQKKRKLSAGQCLREYYKILKSQELPEKLTELEKARKRVLQLETDVVQLKSQCNTEWDKCNTIFIQLSRNDNFDIHDVTPQIKNRITSRLNKEGIISISMEEFIEHYQKESEYGQIIKR